MDSIQLKTKELQSKMYLTQTQTQDSLTQWIQKKAASVEVPRQHFRVERNQFLQLTILCRIL